MKPESRFTSPTELCPHPERWCSEDDQATELQVMELVAAFVRALQPDYVLETGTHLGYCAEKIGVALEENEKGELTSIEIDGERACKARERCSGLPVEIICCSSLIWSPPPGTVIDFAWLDSGGGSLRIEEFWRFRQYFRRGAIIGIHDTAPHQGNIRALVDVTGEDVSIRYIHLPTPRGVSFLEVM